MISTSPELLNSRANSVFMYPAFDHEHIGIDAIGFGQKRLDVQKEKKGS